MGTQHFISDSVSREVGFNSSSICVVFVWELASRNVLDNPLSDHL